MFTLLDANRLDIDKIRDKVSGCIIGTVSAVSGGINVLKLFVYYDGHLMIVKVIPYTKEFFVFIDLTIGHT